MILLYTTKKWNVVHILETTKWETNGKRIFLSLNSKERISAISTRVDLKIRLGGDGLDSSVGTNRNVECWISFSRRRTLSW
jgi:hypothetical protein